MKLFNKHFFSRPEEEQIVETIRQAELCTSGEIRVHLHTSSCTKATMDAALETFYSLGMDKTALHNGVLIYLATKEKKFVILGDEGINNKVSDDFWDSTRNKMQAQFRKGDFVQGLCDGIQEAGEQLKEHFPYESDDENELPDEISYD